MSVFEKNTYEFGFFSHIFQHLFEFQPLEFGKRLLRFGNGLFVEPIDFIETGVEFRDEDVELALDEEEVIRSTATVSDSSDFAVARTAPPMFGSGCTQTGGEQSPGDETRE